MKDAELRSYLSALIRGASVDCEAARLERALGLDGRYALFGYSNASNGGPMTTWLLSSSVGDSHGLRVAALDRIRYALHKPINIRGASPTERKARLVMRGRRKRALALLELLEVESVLESVAR